MMPPPSLAIVAPLLSLLVGCPHPQRVTVRLIDAQPQASRYVPADAYRHFLAAEIAVNRGLHGPAIRHYRRALVSDPGSPYVHTRLAAALAVAGRPDLALPELTAALVHRPGFTDALLLRARLLDRAGDHRAAVRALQQCIEHNRSQPRAYVQLASLLQRQSWTPQGAAALRRARSVLEEMVRLLPAARSGHRALGLVCLQQLDYRCAATAYTRAVELAPTLEALMQLAQIRLARGEARRAIDVLRTAFDRADGHPGVALRLAEALAADGQLRAVDDLVDVLERASHGEPQRLAELAEVGLRGQRPAKVLAVLDAHAPEPPATSGQHGESDRCDTEDDRQRNSGQRNIGQRGGTDQHGDDEHRRASASLSLLRARALAALQRHAESEALLRRLVDGPRGDEAVILLAAAEQRRGQVDRACGLLRQAIGRSGQQSALVSALARCVERAGQPARALAVVRQALEQQPSDYQLQFVLAMTLERGGRWREAVAVIERLARLRPDDPAVHNFIGYVKAEHNVDLPGAERSLRRALYLGPGEPYVIDSMGWLLFRRGQLAAAESALQVALRLSPDEAEIVDHLADVRAALNQRSAAARLYRRALDLSRDVRLSDRIRGKLERLTRDRVGQRRDRPAPVP